MAITIAYQAPRLLNSGPSAMDDPIINKYPFTGTLVEGDILFLSAGVLNKASANQASIAGMAMAGSGQVYHAASNPGVGLNFAQDQTGTALVPGTEQNLGLVQFDDGIRLEINLIQSTTLAASLVGTQVGLGYDATSGFFFVDPGQTNKIAYITQIPGGPDMPFVGSTTRGFLANGQIGDSGGRVVVAFLASALQI